MGYRYNPFTGQLDRIREAQTGLPADKVIIEDVPAVASLAVGDLCVFNSGALEKPADNANTTIPFGVVGFVDAKPTSTTANVTVAGTVTGQSGLTVGEPIFVSLLGALSHTAPTTGTIQHLGFAISATSIALAIKQNFRQV